jgi:hypothetical protein
MGGRRSLLNILSEIYIFCLPFCKGKAIFNTDFNFKHRAVGVTNVNTVIVNKNYFESRFNKTSYRFIFNC